ncbi:MAG: hypothetical protein ACYTEL_05995 [Planctomycetota bacterium]
MKMTVGGTIPNPGRPGLRLPLVASCHSERNEVERRIWLGRRVVSYHAQARCFGEPEHDKKRER